MVAVLGYSKEQIRQAVTEMYTTVANRPELPQHFPIGPDGCAKAQYRESLLEDIPSQCLESFAGVGCPFRADVIKTGQTVLDVGSGSGTDVMIAAKLVGETGKVFALDLTPAMRDKLQSLLDDRGPINIEILVGDAESIPLPDQSVDVVSSNGVLNLVADKRRAIGEIFRVLKPGGHVQIADIVIASPVTPDCEDDPKLWAECVVGATIDENYLEMFRDAGFEDVQVLRDYDYFSYSPSEDTREIAKQFGAHAFELRMRRGKLAPSRLVQWAKRLDPRRLVREVRRRGLAGVVGLTMTLVACYGTLAAVAILSVLGIALTLNEGVWAATIVAAAGVTTAFVATGVSSYQSPLPLAIALSGTLVLGYAMFVEYSVMTEIGGFGLLAVGTWLDFRKRRWARVTGRGRNTPAARILNSEDGPPSGEYQ